LHRRVLRLPQPSAALDVSEQERDLAGRQQAVNGRGCKHGGGARMTREPHFASRSPLAQPRATAQGNGESADHFARSLLGECRERPFWPY
jgi:hypothetical protein